MSCRHYLIPEFIFIFVTNIFNNDNLQCEMNHINLSHMSQRWNS